MDQHIRLGCIYLILINDVETDSSDLPLVSGNQITMMNQPINANKANPAKVKLAPKVANSHGNINCTAKLIAELINPTNEIATPRT